MSTSYKLLFLAKFQLSPILTLPLENQSQAHYRRICWTENCPIFAKAFAVNVVIDLIESHDYCQVELLCPETECTTSH